MNKKEASKAFRFFERVLFKESLFRLSFGILSSDRAGKKAFAFVSPRARISARPDERRIVQRVPVPLTADRVRVPRDFPQHDRGRGEVRVVRVNLKRGRARSKNGRRKKIKAEETVAVLFQKFFFSEEVLKRRDERRERTVPDVSAST